MGGDREGGLIHKRQGGHVIHIPDNTAFEKLWAGLHCSPGGSASVLIVCHSFDCLKLIHDLGLQRGGGVAMFAGASLHKPGDAEACGESDGRGEADIAVERRSISGQEHLIRVQGIPSGQPVGGAGGGGANNFAWD